MKQKEIIETKSKTIYVADDGREFDDEDDALYHDATLFAERYMLENKVFDVHGNAPEDLESGYYYILESADDWHNIVNWHEQMSYVFEGNFIPTEFPCIITSDHYGKCHDGSHVLNITKRYHEICKQVLQK